MVKSKEKSKINKERNGKIPEIDQGVQVQEAPPLDIIKKVCGI